MSSAAIDGSPRSLADELRGWPDDRLARLLQARPDLAAPIPPDLGVLTARAGVRLSVLRALENVDAFTLALLEGLVVRETTTSYADLADLVGGHDIAAALDRLRHLALVWGEDDALHVVGAVREVLGSHPAGLGRPLAACMARHSDRQLEPVATAVGVDGVTGLVELFADRSRLQLLLDKAGREERKVLETLAAGPPLGQVRDALRVGPVDSPIRWLLAHGLLVAIDNGTVELPREVGLLVRTSPLGDVRPTAPDLETATPRGSDGAAAHAAADVVAKTEGLLEMWSAEPPGVLRAGGLGVRDLKRAAQRIDASEQTAALLIEVAAGAGLVDQSPDFDPLWLPTPAYDGWVGMPTELRWTVLARGWLALPRLPRLVGERGDRDKAAAPLGPDVDWPAAPAERRRVLGVLLDARPGTAATADSVVALLRWRAPRRGGRLRESLPRWTLEEAETLGLTGRGALSSYARDLLTGTDREAARALGALLPDLLDHVLVQPDLTVVAPGPLERDLARELAVVADVESTGGATVYRVSEASVRRALDAGRAASDLHELFRSRSRTPIPQSLTYLVDDVARRHGRLRVGTAASYLRCDDEALLTEVLAAKKASALKLRRLAPTVVTSAMPVGEVLDVLRSLGYAPAAEAADGALLVAAAVPRRTALRPRPPRRTEHVLEEEQAGLAVTALRAGDVAARAARRTPATPASRTSTADTLAFLQDAARERRQVWIGYVDAQGRATSRVVEPRSVEGGFVAAYDYLRGEDRTFAVHRITGVAPVEEGD
ncbi:MAG: helicase C-terminal domain-containing protein [Frankiaceae bacterium]|nr:helicase C-terminal domain-containing protein [Frankiaceae bacterium]